MKTNRGVCCFWCFGPERLIEPRPDVAVSIADGDVNVGLDPNRCRGRGLISPLELCAPFSTAEGLEWPVLPVSPTRIVAGAGSERRFESWALRTVCGTVWRCIHPCPAHAWILSSRGVSGVCHGLNKRTKSSVYPMLKRNAHDAAPRASVDPRSQVGLNATPSMLR